MRIPKVEGVLLLTLTGCPKTDDGMTDPGTAEASTVAMAGTTASEGTTSEITTAPTTGGETTTGTTAGESTDTGEDSCACFESIGGGATFNILCPAAGQASIVGSCSDDVCMYDEPAVDAALAFLATGEPGIVTWNVNTGSFAASASGGAVVRQKAACSAQFCVGGIHIVTGDGKIFTQTAENDDLSGSVSPLHGATLRPADFFTTCAQNPDVPARFDCVVNAMQGPDFDDCSEGEDFGY
jgi:hypothetical protein